MVTIRVRFVCILLLTTGVLFAAMGCSDGSSTHGTDGDVDTEIGGDGDVAEEGEIVEVDGDIEDDDKITDGDGEPSENDGETGDDEIIETETEEEALPVTRRFSGFSASGGTMQGQGMLLHFSFAPYALAAPVQAASGGLRLKSAVVAVPSIPKP